MKPTKNNDNKGAQGADQSPKKDEKIQDTKETKESKETTEASETKENQEKETTVNVSVDIEPKSMELEIVGMSGSAIDGFTVTEKGMPEEGEAFWEENKSTKLRSVTYYFKEDTTLEQLGPPPNDFPSMLLKTRITLVD